jgi:hypothetical protein
LPSLKDAQGAFNIQSTGNLDESCKIFDGQAGQNDVIKGKYTCAGTLSNPGGADSTPTSTGGAKATKSPGVAGHVEISSMAALSVSGLLAAFFGLV